jgi:hypothetical protein
MVILEVSDSKLPDFSGNSIHPKRGRLKSLSRKRLALLTLSFLILGTASSLLTGVWAAAQDSDSSQGADITLKMYPNGDFEVRAHGTLEQSYDYYPSEFPLREMLFTFQSEPIDTDLYSESGSIVFKLGPMYALFLANLDLDIDFHAEHLNSLTTVQLGFPGMVDLDMDVETIFLEETSEGSIDVEATATIWYSLLPEETISMFVLGFPLFKAEIESQLSEYSDGNLEFSSLAITESELGEVSATITAKMTLEGDFAAGITAFAESYAPEYMDPSVQPPFLPEELMESLVSSADVHISYDSEDLAFIIEYEAMLEGDIDEQFNIMKDFYLEELLEQSYTDPDTTRLINSLFLPTEVSVANLRITFNTIMEEDSSTMEFDIDGIVLKPPSPEALLSFLEEVSERISVDDLTLTLEGASLGKEYIEIQVPDETTEPISKESQKVVWNFADLENLDEIAFEAMEEETTSPLTSTYLIPAVGIVVIAAVALWYFMSKRG